MIDYLARCMARFAVIDNESKQYDEQAYVYGFSILLSTLISILLVLIIATITGRLLESFFFMASFIFLRAKGGGFHAKSHARCITLFAVTFIAAIIILTYMIESLYAPFIFFFSALGAIVIWLYAPVAASNKPISRKKHDRHRVQCILIACIYLVLSALTYYIPIMQCDVVLFLYAGYGAAGISMLSAGIKKKRKESGNNV